MDLEKKDNISDKLNTAEVSVTIKITELQWRIFMKHTC